MQYHVSIQIALSRNRSIEGLKKIHRALYESQEKQREDTKKRNDAHIADLQRRLTEQANQIYELTKHKLKFELDVPRSHVTVVSFYDQQFSVTVRLYIRFENSDVHPLTVKRVSILLINKSDDETESEIPLIDSDLYEAVYIEEGRLSKKEYKWNGRNLSVSGRDWTLYHTIEGHINADGFYQEILTQHCFLRVIMEAMNQPPYSLDFNVNWGGINQGWVHLTPRT